MDKTALAPDETTLIKCRCDQCRMLFTAAVFYQRFCSKKCRADWHNEQSSMARKAGRLLMAQHAANPVPQQIAVSGDIGRFSPATFDGPTARARTQARYDQSQSAKAPATPTKGKFVETRRK